MLKPWTPLQVLSLTILWIVRKRLLHLQRSDLKMLFQYLRHLLNGFGNIIKDNGTTAIDSSLFKEDAESALAASFDSVETAVEPLLAAADYEQALSAMLALKTPVDAFFDSVMVMDEDSAIRQNRLNLLTAISTLFLKVGDISKMQSN